MHWRVQRLPSQVSHETIDPEAMALAPEGRGALTFSMGVVRSESRSAAVITWLATVNGSLLRPLSWPWLCRAVFPPLMAVGCGLRRWGHRQVGQCIG